MPTFDQSVIDAAIAGPASTTGSLFAINGAVSVQSTDNTFKYCYTGLEGGVFSLTGTTFTDSASTF